MAKPILIYGVNGYTGRLVLEECLARGIRPVLSGRSDAAVRELAVRHGLEARPAALDDTAAFARALAGIGAVIHCAGPFMHTAQPMLDACLAAKAHYLDINGEITTFERVAATHQRAADAGVSLMPGVGFDVVPTDCLIAHLKRRLPSATAVELAFSGGSGPSHGTAATMIEGLGLGGAMRRGGKIVRIPAGWRTRTAPFADKPRLCVTIAWGDVSMAYHSTGIPDITTYMATHPSTLKWLRLVRLAAPLLRTDFVKDLLKRQLKHRPAGPSAEALERSRSQIWAEVRDGAGKVASARLTTMAGYKLTALTAVRSAERLLAGEVAAGFFTPSKAFGPDYILEFPDCVREDLT